MRVRSFFVGDKFFFLGLKQNFWSESGLTHSTHSIPISSLVDKFIC